MRPTISLSFPSTAKSNTRTSSSNADAKDDRTQVEIRPSPSTSDHVFPPQILNLDDASSHLPHDGKAIEVAEREKMTTENIARVVQIEAAEAARRQRSL